MLSTGHILIIAVIVRGLATATTTSSSEALSPGIISRGASFIEYSK